MGNLVFLPLDTLQRLIHSHTLKLDLSYVFSE